MTRTSGIAGVALALVAMGGSAAWAQVQLLDVMVAHGIVLPNRNFERGFDEGMAPTVPLSPGALATPLAMMSATGGDRIAAAFAFGMLVGRSGHAASRPELAAAGYALVQMIGSADRRSRIAGARVAGRIFAAPLEPGGASPPLPAGMVDALFGLLNHGSQSEELAAMDALGLLRETLAVSALLDRYHFYRQAGKRALAGGALEALARIGDPSAVAIARALAADPWSAGKDPTALAVAFARERLLKDGSVALIQQALDDRSRRAQARGYLLELGVRVP